MNDPRQVPDLAPAIEQRRKLLKQHIDTLNRNAVYWASRQKTAQALIGFYTLNASVIMAVNLVLRGNLQNVGGWIPFCITAAVLTAVATHLQNGQRMEDPGARWAECLQALQECRALERKLDRRPSVQWTEGKLDAFERRMDRLEREFTSCMVPPARISHEAMMYAFLVVVVGIYIAYEVGYVFGFNWLG